MAGEGRGQYMLATGTLGCHRRIATTMADYETSQLPPEPALSVLAPFLACEH